MRTTRNFLYQNTFGGSLFCPNPIVLGQGKSEDEILEALSSKADKLILDADAFLRRMEERGVTANAVGQSLAIQHQMSQYLNKRGGLPKDPYDRVESIYDQTVQRIKYLIGTTDRAYQLIDGMRKPPKRPPPKAPPAPKPGSFLQPTPTLSPFAQPQPPVEVATLPPEFTTTPPQPIATVPARPSVSTLGPSAPPIPVPAVEVGPEAVATTAPTELGCEVDMNACIARGGVWKPWQRPCCEGRPALPTGLLTETAQVPTDAGPGLVPTGQFTGGLSGINLRRALGRSMW